ncbi:MAG TPA: TonB-dependent receptor [Gemmatimonadales bacterium]
MRRFGYGVLTLLVVLAVARPAVAQRLRGRLLDVESGEPLVAGFVTLLALDGTTLVTAVSDREGQWLVEMPAPGSYYVAAKRMGYRPWVAGPIAVQAGDDLTALYHLQRLPVTLDPLEVTAQATRRFLELSGFYERQRADFGYFITPEFIEQRQAVRITDLISGLPGVSLVPTGTGSVGPLAVQLRGGNLSQQGLCRPRVFVDGLLYTRGDSRPRRADPGRATERSTEDEIQRLDQSISIDDIGPASLIAAVEVYRSATEVPVQFGGTSVETLCGVIVIWTRFGSARVRVPADSARR